MIKVSEKFITLFLCLICLFAKPAIAQENCFNCKLDSLAASLNMAKTDNEKIAILKLLGALKLPAITTVNDTVARYCYQSLVEFSKSRKIENIDAYKSILQGIKAYEKKDFLGAQNAFKAAIVLFDKTHKIITQLLTVTRLTYNELGNQEDRYQYYTEKLHYYLVNGPHENLAPCYHSLAGYYLYKADYNLAISNYLRAVDIYKNLSLRNYYNILSVVGNTYSAWGNLQKGEEYFDLAINFAKMENDSLILIFSYINLSGLYRDKMDFPKSLLLADSALAIDPKNLSAYTAGAYLEKAAAFIGLNRLQEALLNLDNAKKISDSFNLKIFAAYGTLETDYGYYKYYAARKVYDKAISYLLSAYRKSVEVKSNRLQLKYLKELYLFYGNHGQSELAFNYINKYNELTDELDRDNRAFKVAQYENEEREIRQNDSLNILKQRGAVQAAIIKKNDLLLWGSLVAIILISTSMFFVYRQYRLNRKTLLSLRKTQRQLIVAEKMASLGEITAGIAHEIQNPLNFVTNFSEVNRELIGEMKGELLADNKQEAISIANHIDENEQKINHHGRRADAIVKGMLQHSREGKGRKEPTDLNALADEYFRLSYQGLRAKDKSFNAAMKTDFDASIGKINVIPQDIGRVLLNLYNNAFYAAAALTAKGGNGNSPADTNPTVWVSTKKSGNNVLISVRDNGPGISQKIMDKIFQPFFTTKPTGQGTGLGLSLSYDIVKAHGGEIKVETKENEGAEFIIQLPLV